MECGLQVAEQSLDLSSHTRFSLGTTSIACAVASMVSFLSLGSPSKYLSLGSCGYTDRHGYRAWRAGDGVLYQHQAEYGHYQKWPAPDLLADCAHGDSLPYSPAPDQSMFRRSCSIWKQKAP